MHELLKDCLKKIQEPYPFGSLPVYIGTHPCGVMPLAHLQVLEKVFGSVKAIFRPEPGRFVLRTEAFDPDVNKALNIIAHRLDDAGVLSKWRNEDLDIFDRETGESFAKAERAVFRFFGFLTQAVYAVGYTEDKRLMSGLRSPTKPIDPNLWDTLAAGLVASGETPEIAILRELGEEAGLTESDIEFVGQPLRFNVTRSVPEGWMEESALVYACRIPDVSKVHNVDGEVAQFALFSKDELLEKIRAEKTPADTAVAFLKTIASWN